MPFSTAPHRRRCLHSEPSNNDVECPGQHGAPSRRLALPAPVPGLWLRGPPPVDTSPPWASEMPPFTCGHAPQDCGTQREEAQSGRALLHPPFL